MRRRAVGPGGRIWSPVLVILPSTLLILLSPRPSPPHVSLQGEEIPGKIIRRGGEGQSFGYRCQRLRGGCRVAEDLEKVKISGKDGGNGRGAKELRKRHLNIVFIGHVDAGKSTIAGHILALTGMVDERTIEKCEKDAQARGRESWGKAYLLDTTEGERNKGKTEECGHAYFETNTTRVTILDAPGHKGYVPHMIGGASQADVGVLIISGRKGEFETGFDKGGQTREHAVLAKTAGVKRLIVCVNKLDDPSVKSSDGKWSELRYVDIKTKLLPFLKGTGWKPKDVISMPISGLLGEGLLKRVDPTICPWYKGPSLIEALENIAIPSNTDTRVILPITASIKEREGILMGKLESGTITLGDRLEILPEKKSVTVSSLAIPGGEETDKALSGEAVRVGISGVDVNSIHPGGILASPNANLTSAVKLEAVLLILDAKHVIVPGYSAVMHIHAAEVPCTVYKLTAELNRRTGEFVRRHPQFARTGMRVQAKILLDRPTVVKAYKDLGKLGRFMLRAEGKTVAVGTVLRVAKILSSDTKSKK